MQIRTGTPVDHPGVLDLYRRARSEPPTPDRLDRVATQLDQELLVVAEDDGLVGFALGGAERDDERANAEASPAAPAMQVSMVLVDPARRREGVGAALLEGLADLGWAQGYRSLSSWSSMPAFFEACGLRRTGEEQPLADGRITVRLSAELEAPARQLVLDGPGIRLGQLLKFAGIVDTGAEAKSLLATAGVEVNDEVDTRRGRQLRDGDEVRARGQVVVVRLPSTL